MWYVANSDLFRAVRRVVVGLAGLLLPAAQGAAVADARAALPAPSTIISSSPQLRLTARDYRPYVRALSETDRQRLAGDRKLLRELVLDFHSNAVLAQEAEGLKLDDDPEVREALREARERVLIAALERHIRQGIQYPDFATLARERYERDREAYVVPEQRKLAHILLKPEDACICPADPQRKTPEEVLKGIEAGGDFADLAREYSIDRRTAEQGGLIDLWVKADGTMVPAFEEAAFALKEPGDISGPVKTRFGVHIIKLVEVRPSHQLGVEEVKDRIIEQLRQEYLQSALDSARAKAYPELDSIDYDALEGLVSPPATGKQSPTN